MHGFLHKAQRKLLRSTWWLIAAVPGVTHAGADVYGQVTVATDYLFRGVSQTMSGPALQAELGVEHDSGWYGYAWASNVRFTDGSAPDDGARVELNLGVGYILTVNERLTLELGATAYRFPDTKPGYDYDYDDWHIAIGVDDEHRLTVGYSGSVFNSGTGGTYYELGTVRALTDRLNLCLEVGHYDLERAYQMSYQWGEVAVTGTSPFFDWRLSYFRTAGSAGKIFEPSTIDNRLVFELSLPF